ncbi:ras-related protein Rap-1b-like [Parasteatoda tepidariorum]|uniref:ras-related protein Rap-1b-like n=1 Tax=Parasteatoda tepidariorum TaxID=114398 RepID=UPI00077FAFA5|nr:ras-related protein Rap-1b-like [Parasteatoda tepidariorum]
MGDSDSDCHYRLVSLGGSAVGKSAILKRFLFGTYCDRHRPTVEDLYHREFDILGTQLKVTFLDTAGDMQFPAMRRLSIANGQAFLLVYSIDNEDSFRIIKQCFEEIREQKPDFQELPILVVGNKCDVPEDRRQVKKEDVNEWVFCELPKLRAKIMECSAKDNTNIREVFRSYLQLAKINIPTEHTALRRRSSTHVTIGRPLRFNSSLSPQRESESSPETQQQSTSQKQTKPRSRSLIRRTSKKTNKLKDAAPGCSNDSDCHIS